MRLTDAQKDAILANAAECQRAGAELVRTEDQWSVVWRDLAAPPAARWLGQLVKEVRVNADVLAMTERIEHVVVWTGSVFTARTRRDIIDLLRLEALV